MGKEKTTIQIYNTTRKRLSDIGKRSESYDDIIVRILDEKKQNKQ